MYDPFAEFNTDKSPILFPVGLRSVGWKGRNGGYDDIPGSRAIIRLNQEGTRAYPLSVVSSTYKLVHNRELFQTVERSIVSNVSSAQLEGVQVLDKVAHHGKNCYRTYIFPNMKCDIGSRSPIAFRVITQNGYGGTALRLLSGAIEFYCTNGMVAGQYDQVYRRHTSQLRIDYLDDVIRNSIATFWNKAEEYKRWVAKSVTREQTMQLFREIARSPTFFNALSNQWVTEVEQRGMNVWSAYSTLTYYASHNEGDFEGRYLPETVEFNMVNRELEVARWIDSRAWHTFVGERPQPTITRDEAQLRWRNHLAQEEQNLT